jgi:DNA-binding CsgD family transcriptional regulator
MTRRRALPRGADETATWRGLVIPARGSNNLHEMSAAFFGRACELDAIDRFLERARDGAAGLLVVGEPGIGKTILWERGLAHAAEAGALVLSCRAAEAEATLSFAGLADVLGDRVDEALDGLAGPRRRALEVALLLDQPAPGDPDLRALGAGFLDVLRRFAASRQVLLAVDDLQWLDAPSAAVLAFAFRRLREEPVGLFATVRTGAEATLPLSLSSFERLSLGPLSLGALHHVLRERLGLELARSGLSRLHRTTGGNPFFALEVGRELVRRQLTPAPGEPLPVPDTLHELLERRLARIAPQTREVLLSVAALARPTAEALTAAHGPEATGSLEEAARAGVIELSDARVRFSHPLLAEVCYRDAPAWTRRAAHRVLAGVVTDVEEQARQLALAAEAPDPEVAAALDRAAELSAARGAPTPAAELWEQAAKLTPPNDRAAGRRRRFSAARAHRLAGDNARAAAMFEDLLPDALPGAERADVLFALASTRRGSLPVLAALCEEALREVADDDGRAAQISIFLSWIVVSRGDVRRALAVAREGLSHAERTGDPALIARAIGRVAMAETWTAEITPGLLERGVELEEGLGHFLEAHESPAVALERRLICQGELERARSVLERLEAASVERGDESTRGLLLVHLTLVEWYAGRWPAALDHARAALELAEQIGDDQLRGLVLNVRALVELYLGRVEEARRAVEQSQAAADAASDVLLELWNRGVLGSAALALGDPAGAAEQLRELPARFTELGWTDPADHFWPDAIEALVTVAELEPARTYLDQLEDLGRRLDSRWVRANACRCRGLLAAAEGELEAAFASFEQALTEHERLSAPFERARTLLAVGSVRRRARQKRAARETLEQALSLFEELGATLWAEQAREELARIGGRRVQHELTAAEQRVAALAAEGRSNKEIAAALFVTPHTVESHLSRVYQKLGIRSRAGLVPLVRAATPEDGAGKV